MSDSVGSLKNAHAPFFRSSTPPMTPHSQPLSSQPGRSERLSSSGGPQRFVSHATPAKHNVAVTPAHRTQESPQMPRRWLGTHTLAHEHTHARCPQWPVVPLINCFYIIYTCRSHCLQCAEYCQGVLVFSIFVLLRLYFYKEGHENPFGGRFEF